MLKSILKLIGAFLIGISFGGSISALIVILFTDMPLGVFLQKMFSEGSVMILMGIFFFFVSIPIQIILHEGGHWVCGLLSGYRFVSFRIFHWTFIREDGKIRIKRFALAGTGGQCLLSPPDKPLDEIPVVWYNLGGVLANVLVTVAAFGLMSVVESTSWVHQFLFYLGLVGVFLILMNGIPLKVGGITNDAYNVLLLRKDVKSKQALMVQLRANALFQQGVRIKDIPEEWCDMGDVVDYKNPLILAISNLSACRLLDRQEWEKAHQAFEEMYRHKSEIIELYVKEIACELVFTSLVTGRMEQARELYTDDLKKYMEQYRKVMSSKERILCIVALLMEENRPKAEAIYNQVCQRRQDYLMQGEVLTDISLMQAILSR